jgi:hypothetical protein
MSILYLKGVRGVLTIYSNKNDGSYQIPPTHQNYKLILEALEREDDAVFNLLTAPAPVEISEPEPTEIIEVVNKSVTYNGRKITNSVLVDMIDRLGGIKVTAIRRFLDRLTLNPRIESVQMLLAFLKHRNLPITRAGHFLAYKGVRADYKDYHTGTFDNSPGCINFMRRSEVTFDPKIACSKGFHCGTYNYASAFGADGNIVICDVDPFDVVSVPKDENEQKLRVARYKVIGDCKHVLQDMHIYSADGSDLDLNDYIGDLRTEADSYGKLHCSDAYDDDNVEDVDDCDADTDYTDDDDDDDSDTDDNE